MAGLAALPSSSVALVITRSASAGVSNGIAASIGIVLGDLVFVLLAILGLTAIAELMGGFFSALKIVGGLYLIWLGISLLKSKGRQPLMEAHGQKSGDLLLSLAAGFFLTLGDMKAIFFYASLLPLFIDLRSASAYDYTLVATITVLSVGSTKILYAIFASKFAVYLQGKQLSKRPQRTVGGLMVGIGSYVILRAGSS